MEHAPQSSDPLIGKIISDRYRVLERIGRGGFGAVYKVQHIRLDKILALKVLFEHTHQNPRMIKRFEREARATCRIGHDNIVEITDFSRDRSVGYYFVMEHLVGETLSDRLQALGPMEPARLVHIAMQMTDALAATHAKGIVHRDLKPDNVFLVRKRDISDFVKILDFGIAAMTDLEEEVPRLTRHGTMLGTPAYMSPEQAEAKTADHRADIYSFGVMLYEMTTGTVPFNNASSLAVLEMHRTTKPVPPRIARPELDTPVGIEKVIMRALRKPLTERYQSMREIYNDLAQLAKQMDMSALDAPIPELRVDQPPALPSDDIDAEEPEWLDEDLVLLDEDVRSTPNPTIALPNTPLRLDSRTQLLRDETTPGRQVSNALSHNLRESDETVISARRFISTESRDTLSVTLPKPRKETSFWKRPMFLIVLGFVVTLGFYVGFRQIMHTVDRGESEGSPAAKERGGQQPTTPNAARPTTEKRGGDKTRGDKEMPGERASGEPGEPVVTKTTNQASPPVVAGRKPAAGQTVQPTEKLVVPRRTGDETTPEQRRPNRPLEVTGVPPYVQITVSSDPAGASVFWGGKLKGVTPLALRIAPQDIGVPVKIQLKGYKTNKRTIVPNNNTSFHVKLHRKGGRKGGKRRTGKRGSTYDLWDD